MPLVSGVTLNVACPTTAWSLRFSAVKNTSCCSPRWTLTSRCTGSNRHGRPGATLLSNRTVMICSDAIPESAFALCGVPPNPVAAQKSRYNVGEYAVRPTMMPITATHAAMTFKFLRCRRFILGPFWRIRWLACFDLFRCVAVLVHHRTEVPVLHGANFGNRNAHVLLAGFFERQGQRKGLSLLQRLLQSNHHDVHISWIEGDRRSRCDFNRAHLTHARYAVLFAGAVKLDFVRHRCCRAKQAVAGTAVIDQRDIYGAGLCPGGRGARPQPLNDDYILARGLRMQLSAETQREQQRRNHATCFFHFHSFTVQSCAFPCAAKL